MIKFGFVACMVPLLFTACVTSQHQKRQCALGNMTEITVASDSAPPQQFALETAARSTLNAGYEKFSVVSEEAKGNSYMMLIKMVPYTEIDTDFNDVVARDLLISHGLLPPSDNVPL